MAADAESETEAADAGGDGVDYEVSSEDRTWGILAHAAAFAGLVIPFAHILGPLLVWAIKKEESRFVAENGRQALNFQLTWTLLFVLAGLTVFIAIGVVLVPILLVAWLILVIIAIIRASNERVYAYPLTLEVIS